VKLATSFCKRSAAEQAEIAVARNSESNASHHQAKMKVAFPHPCYLRGCFFGVCTNY
jgi:hypothetical protein